MAGSLRCQHVLASHPLFQMRLACLQVSTCCGCTPMALLSLPTSSSLLPHSPSLPSFPWPCHTLTHHTKPHFATPHHTSHFASLGVTLGESSSTSFMLTNDGALDVEYEIEVVDQDQGEAEQIQEGSAGANGSAGVQQRAGAVDGSVLDVRPFTLSPCRGSLAGYSRANVVAMFRCGPCAAPIP